MGMFSIGVREINEINEIRVHHHADPISQRASVAALENRCSELDVATGKLSERELQILLHYGAEVYMESVREIDPTLAGRMEGEMNVALRSAKKLTLSEQLELAARVVKRARVTMATLIKSGGF